MKLKSNKPICDQFTPSKEDSRICVVCHNKDKQHPAQLDGFPVITDYLLRKN